MSTSELVPNPGESIRSEQHDRIFLTLPNRFRRKLIGIKQVDAVTDNTPAYDMVKCAHPTHFAEALTSGKSCLERIRGIWAKLDNPSIRRDADIYTKALPMGYSLLFIKRQKRE